jgi:hypothetical protein
MKKITTYLVLIIIACNLSCSKKENPLEKERKEFYKKLEDNTVLTIYRGAKVSLRSIPGDGNLNNLDSLYNKMGKNQAEGENIQKYTVYLISALLKASNDSSTISISEGFEMVKMYSKLKDELKNTDEDSFPTLLEILLYINKLNGTDNQIIIKELKWSNSKEHLIIAAGLMAAKQLPVTMQLYELSKLDIGKLENTEIKPLSGMIKGIVFMQNKWNYLAEEALEQSINSLDNDNIQFEYSSFPVLFEGSKVETKEAQKIQLHALACVLRGFVRTKMDNDDKKELAIKDFELFIADANKLGVDNELVWIAGTYVAINKEDNKQAIVYLDKLHASKYFTDNEKDAIKDIKDYLSDRKPDKALNVIYDKIFIGKLVTGYLINYFTKIDWYKAINQTKAGQQMFELPNLIDTESKKIESITDPSKLQEKGKELLRDLVK